MVQSSSSESSQDMDGLSLAFLHRLRKLSLRNVTDDTSKMVNGKQQRWSNKVLEANITEKEDMTMIMEGAEGPSSATILSEPRSPSSSDDPESALSEDLQAMNPVYAGLWKAVGGKAVVSKHEKETCYVIIKRSKGK